MELHGTLDSNLLAALLSIRRLKGHPVHPDTEVHWKSLVQHARREVAASSSEPILSLTLELESELADRSNLMVPKVHQPGPPQHEGDASPNPLPDDLNECGGGGGDPGRV
jgi:hypothetical protein